jgi:hypothetical protein
LFQVSNQADCIKAAGDFLFPDHLEHCLWLTTKFCEENLVEDPWMMDVLQVKRTVLHAYINIREQCVGLECSNLSSAANLEDNSVVIDYAQNSHISIHTKIFLGLVQGCTRLYNCHKKLQVSQAMSKF